MPEINTPAETIEPVVDAIEPVVEDLELVNEVDTESGTSTVVKVLVGVGVAIVLGFLGWGGWKLYKKHQESKEDEPRVK